MSEGEEDILAQCISSGMPTPTSSARKSRRPSSDSTVKRRSGIPTKSDIHLSSSNSISSTKSSCSPSKASSESSVSKPAASQSGFPNQKIPSVASSSSKPPRPGSKGQRHGNKSEINKSSISRQIVSPKSGSSKSPLPGSSQSKSHPSKQQQSNYQYAFNPGNNESVEKNSRDLVTHDQNSVSNHQPVKSSASKNLTSILNNAAKATSPPKISGKSPVKTSNLLPMMQDIESYAEDSFKVYETEGTPLNFSNATSLSDLSTHTQSSNSPKKLKSANFKSAENDDKSDTSSVCEETEEQLLNQMIQSGMPKGKNSKKGATDLNDSSSAVCGDGNNDVGKGSSRDCNLSAFVPRTSNIQLVAPFNDFITLDSVKTYNVEGTPKNFSATTSLSDLTIDSIGPTEKSNPTAKAVCPKTNRSQGIGNLASPQKKPIHTHNNIHNNVHNNGDSFYPLPNDTLHTYGVEGTPVNFSRNDSLSSLGAGEVEEVCNGGKKVKNSKTSNRPFTDHAVKCENEIDVSSLPHGERHVIGQSSEDSSISGDKADKPIKFCVEDTPVCFSRNSSLSSLNSDHEDQIGASKQSSSGNPVSGRPKSGDLSGSVSKTKESPDSSDDELGDQALLEQCISAAMPKSRIPRGDEHTRRHVRAKFSIQQRGNKQPQTGQGITKSASVEIPTGNTSPSPTKRHDNHLSNGSQTSLYGSDINSNMNNLMTRSCSDTTDLDLEFPMSDRRQSRYQVWQRRQRHHSQEEMSSQYKLSQPQDYPAAKIRSHSQDNENSQKLKKDISNKLAQASQRSASGSYQGSLDSLDTISPGAQTFYSQQRLVI